MKGEMNRTALAEFVMEQAKNAGASACSLRLSSRRSVQVEVRDGQVDKLQESMARGLSVELFVDGRYSTHTTQKLDETSLKPFVADAVALTRYLSPDNFRRLPEPELTKFNTEGDLQVLDPSYEKLESPRRIELVKATEAGAREAAGSTRLSTSSGWSDVHTEVTSFNSNGFRGDATSSVFSLQAEATVKDGDKGRPEEGAYSRTRYMSDQVDPTALGAEAARRALARVGQSKQPSGSYDILVENRVARGLLDGLLQSMTANAIHQKNSFLDAKLGQKIASEKLTLIDDPLIVRGLGSMRFDHENLALRKRMLIESGVLKNFLADNYFGRKLGLRPNGGYTSNLAIQGGEGNLEGLVKILHKGILINGWIGGNFNGTTGDFSYGIMGQLVENGRVVKPVNEMNLTGNFIDLWNSLERIGGDPDRNSSWNIPSLLFRGLQLSGT
jgi:PmbA protein